MIKIGDIVYYKENDPVGYFYGKVTKIINDRVYCNGWYTNIQDAGRNPNIWDQTFCLSNNVYKVQCYKQKPSWL